MSGYLPLTFIREKIEELENALFFSMSDSVLKIPTCVIKVLNTDEIGQLWFQIPKPSQFIHAFDKTFPVKLDFFRKGQDYYIKIFGKGFVVNDPEELNAIDWMDEQTRLLALKNETIFIKVQIASAEYSEKTPDVHTAKMLLNQVKNKIYRWFQMSQPAPQHSMLQVPAHVTYPTISSYTN